ncbi:MAG: FtsX-like permease family protein [candidate division Zixibacteria bacterium]|nr:FtsX-like permease family protein [candidate division Zixibacteria bacterium]
MVMSILERTREIGVLKSLGADDRDIRMLFLVESGVIGTIGAALGIVFGWLITRAASAIAKAMMAKDGFGRIELFALPLWLVLIALGIGIIVSLAAGYYPAARAARVDPVKALRAE